MSRLFGATLLCLSLFVQGCASTSTVGSWKPCIHPVVDARSNAGLVMGLVEYHAELELCNAINGAESPQSTSGAKE